MQGGGRLVDNENLRQAVVTGLSNFLNVPVIRGSQNAEPPDYPFISYSVTTVASANNGTYGVYADGIYRIPVVQTWSITALSDKEDESLSLAERARDYLSEAGRTELNDRNVIVQAVTAITNRDNMISIEYEYRNGFDVDFWTYDEIEKDNETIERVSIKNCSIDVKKIKGVKNKCRETS